MNRIIKFRAWNKIMRDMEYNILNYSPDFLYSVFHNDKYELMQYTGLKDIVVNEVYDGDLFYYHEILRKVTYREDNASFMAEVVKGNIGSCNFYLKDIVDSYKNKLRVEIIGNIYENPMLIE